MTYTGKPLREPRATTYPMRAADGADLRVIRGPVAPARELLRIHLEGNPGATVRFQSETLWPGELYAEVVLPKEA